MLDHQGLHLRAIAENLLDENKRATWQKVIVDVLDYLLSVLKRNELKSKDRLDNTRFHRRVLLTEIKLPKLDKPGLNVSGKRFTSSGNHRLTNFDSQIAIS